MYKVNITANGDAIIDYTIYNETLIHLDDKFLDKNINIENYNKVFRLRCNYAPLKNVFLVENASTTYEGYYFCNICQRGSNFRQSEEDQAVEEWRDIKSHLDSREHELLSQGQYVPPSQKHKAR